MSTILSKQFLLGAGAVLLAGVVFFACQSAGTQAVGPTEAEVDLALEDHLLVEQLEADSRLGDRSPLSLERRPAFGERSEQAYGLAPELGPIDLVEPLDELTQTQLAVLE